MIPRGLRAVPYNVREHRGRGRACASGRRRQAGLAGLRAKISSPLPARSARGGQALTEGVLRVCGEEMYIYDTMDLSGSMRARIPDASTRIVALDRACRGKCKVLGGAVVSSAGALHGGGADAAGRR